MCPQPPPGLFCAVCTSFFLVSLSLSLNHKTLQHLCCPDHHCELPYDSALARCPPSPAPSETPLVPTAPYFTDKQGTWPLLIAPPPLGPWFPRPTSVSRRGSGRRWPQGRAEVLAEASPASCCGSTCGQLDSLAKGRWGTEKWRRVGGSCGTDQGKWSPLGKPPASLRATEAKGRARGCPTSW